MQDKNGFSTNGKQILLVGSSHTGLAFIFIKIILHKKAIVSKLPGHAGTTDEMMVSLPGWPVTGKDIVYIYAGHRDLMFDAAGRITVNLERFEKNLETIINTVVSRCSAKIVLSNVPPVADDFLEMDVQRNERISLYNNKIKEVADRAAVYLHDFSSFVLKHKSGMEKYSDGLHFKREFYNEYANDLADFLLSV